MRNVNTNDSKNDAIPNPELMIISVELPLPKFFENELLSVEGLALIDVVAVVV